MDAVRRGRRRGQCRICKLSLHQEGIFCQKCAYGCSMCGVKVWDTTYHNVGGIRGPPAGTRAETRAGRRRAAAANETGRRLTVEEQEARDATEKEAREEAERVRAEKAERARRTADAVASNRLAGSTSLASAAREMATAAAGKAVTGWQYDATSGLYYDVASQTYYDAKTKKYFDCKTNAWIEPEKPTNAEMATGAKSGSFGKGTRKPDRFGL